MNPLRTLLSIFPQPLHAFMSQGRFYVYISAGPDLEIRQPFHDSIFGTRQIRQPLQGRRISRVPKTTRAHNYYELSLFESYQHILMLSSCFAKVTGNHSPKTWHLSTKIIVARVPLVDGSSPPGVSEIRPRRFPWKKSNVNICEIHPGRLTWKLQPSPNLDRKRIWKQTSMIMFHVNLLRCKGRKHQETLFCDF